MRRGERRVNDKFLSLLTPVVPSLLVASSLSLSLSRDREREEIETRVARSCKADVQDLNTANCT